MIELTFIQEDKKQPPTHRRLIRISCIEAVAETEEKETLLIFYEKHGIFRSLRCATVAETFDQVKAMLVRNRG